MMSTPFVLNVHNMSSGTFHCFNQKLFLACSCQYSQEYLFGFFLKIIYADTSLKVDNLTSIYKNSIH